MLIDSAPLDKTKSIGALVKTSLVDYPSHVAASVFFHGCNLRCPYCYNFDLVTGSFHDYDAVSIEEIEQHLEKRKKVLSGLVLSGGEALLSPFVKELISFAKNLNYKVKIDTNGSLPEKLEELLNDDLLKPDFVALDVKTSLKKYELFSIESNRKLIAEKVLKSIELVSGLPKDKREFRTVLVPTFIDEEDVKELSSLLPADADWKFASFSNKNCLNHDFEKIEPYSYEEMEKLISIARLKIKDSVLR